jgi:uncharacterized protein YndB with AHSA1/START domain
VTTAVQTTTQTHRIHIKATPDEVWDALTNRGEEYGYHARAEYELRPGGAYKAYANEQMREFGHAEVMVEGEVLEVDAPWRLVQTWDPRFGGEIDAEPPAKLTWQVEEWPNGVTRVTLTADCDGAPMTYGITSGDVAEAMGGWPMVLSDLKTLLETGTSLG